MIKLVGFLCDFSGHKTSNTIALEHIALYLDFK